MRTLQDPEIERPARHSVRIQVTSRLVPPPQLRHRSRGRARGGGVGGIEGYWGVPETSLISAQITLLQFPTDFCPFDCFPFSDCFLSLSGGFGSGSRFYFIYLLGGHTQALNLRALRLPLCRPRVDGAPRDPAAGRAHHGIVIANKDKGRWAA